MPRPSDTSEQEDMILLSTAGLSSAETNQQLVAAGFKTRSAASIKNRRYYLTRNPPQSRDGVSILVQRRQTLISAIEANERKAELLRRQLEAINRELQQQLTDEIQGS